MIQIRVIAGDSVGGPSAEFMLEVDCGLDEITYERIANLRADARNIYIEKFSMEEGPESIIVTVTELATNHG